MSVSPQLIQPAHQVLSGKPNASIPMLQLPHGNMQPSLGVYVSSVSNFWVCSSNLSVTSPNPIQRIPSVYYVALDHIDAGDKILSFTQSIFAKVSYNENGYVCQNEELGIVTMAVNLENCLKDFKDEVLFVWNEYGKEDDSKLTSDAKDLKRKILTYVRQ